MHVDDDDDDALALQGNSMPLLRCRARCCDAGQPPPRLLAPHVIHCRGIATAPDGTACDSLQGNRHRA
jgi:hypothetical protein